MCKVDIVMHYFPIAAAGEGGSNENDEEEEEEDDVEVTIDFNGEFSNFSAVVCSDAEFFDDEICS